MTESVPVTVPAPDPTLPVLTRRRASILWARLLARIDEIRPLTGPRCQGDMHLIAFLTGAASIRIILAHLGEPTTPPPLSPRARAPPELESGPTGSFAFDQSPSWDPIAPTPDPCATTPKAAKFVRPPTRPSYARSHFPLPDMAVWIPYLSYRPGQGRRAAARSRR